MRDFTRPTITCFQDGSMEGCNDSSARMRPGSVPYAVNLSA